MSPTIRWMAAGISLLVVLFLVGGVWVWPLNNLVLNILVAFIIAGVLFFIYSRFVQLHKEFIRLESRPLEIERSALNTQRKLESVIRLSHKFIEAKNENDVVSSVLREINNLTGVLGASMVPVDERGLPMTAISHGDLPGQVLKAWTEYLASPGVRRQCGICQKLGTFTNNCPLIEVPAIENLGYDQSIVVFCLPLRRGDREYGVLNIYLPEAYELDEETQDFMRLLLDETSLVMENIHQQDQGLSVRDHLHGIRLRLDLDDLESNLLTNVCKMLDTDFSLFYLKSITGHGSRKQIRGKFPEAIKSDIDNILSSVLNTGNPLLIGELKEEPGDVKDLHSVVAAPIKGQDNSVLGVLIAGSSGLYEFNNQHQAMLQIFSDQVSLLLQFEELLADIEFNAIVGERNRLAREIHDGIAQTLGFLKLHTARMKNQLASYDTDYLQDGISTMYEVLSEAYLEVRQTIDNLRVGLEDGEFSEWIEKTCLEFQDNTGMQVQIMGSGSSIDLPSELQAQLIRIIQEALSNVRKHASASQAWVIYNQSEENFWIEVRDDGCGFLPEDVPGGSHYGLQGMRERSELIGADFQVSSHPGEGTIVRVRLPLQVGENCR